MSRAPVLVMAAATVALAMGAPSAASAQTSAALELRAGGGVGQYGATRGELDRSPHPAWRVGVSISPLPRLHLVAAYGHSAFGCEGGFCIDSDVTFASAGGELGVRFDPAGAGRGPWVQGDLIAHRLRAAWPGDTEDSGRALGWGLAVGYHHPVAPRLAISPAIRVQTYATAMGADPEAYRVSLATAELGLRLRLR